MHQFDVRHVLASDLGNRDIQDVEVLASDQVKQQVERAFECIEDYFQRIRRDVQILRHRQHRLATYERQRHFLLLRYLRKAHVGFRSTDGLVSLVGHDRSVAPCASRRGLDSNITDR